MGSMFKFIRFPSKRHDPSQATDEQLITGINQKEPDAWPVFLNRYTDLIYRKAYDYSRTDRRQTEEDFEDEVASLYLFMAEYLKNSLKSFQGKCKARTWVTAIVGNRSRVLKAYLLHKAPERADVRIPRPLLDRPAVDHEIFRRLIWGFDTAYIAQDLDISENQCREVEDFIADHSRRVYERIQANRARRAPHLSLGTSDDEDENPLDLADPDATPEESLQNLEMSQVIEKAVIESVRALSIDERRILILLYSQSLKPADILRLTESGVNLGLPPSLNLNRIYYLKDRGLKTICAMIRERFGLHPEEPESELVESLEGYLTDSGFPAEMTPDEH
jgi:hypothetical protein